MSKQTTAFVFLFFYGRIESRGYKVTQRVFGFILMKWIASDKEIKSKIVQHRSTGVVNFLGYRHLDSLFRKRVYSFLRRFRRSNLQRATSANWSYFMFQLCHRKMPYSTFLKHNNSEVRFSSRSLRRYWEKIMCILTNSIIGQINQRCCSDYNHPTRNNRCLFPTERQN